MTQTFAYFAAPSAPFFFPGAAFVLAAALMLVAAAMLLAQRPRRAAPVAVAVRPE